MLKRPVCECGHDDDEHFKLEGSRWNCAIMHCECKVYVDAKKKTELYKQYGVDWKGKERA